MILSLSGQYISLDALALSHFKNGDSIGAAYSSMMNNPDVLWMNYGASDVKAALGSAGYNLSELPIETTLMVSILKYKWPIIGIGLAVLGITLFPYLKR